LAAASGAADDIGYFEWSSDYDLIDDSPKFWAGAAMANPALGHTVHIDNLRAVMNDPPDVVRTEVFAAGYRPSIRRFLQVNGQNVRPMI
jgi:hypothetical protein